MFISRIDSMEELARAPFLHDVRARPARQLAEAVGAVHDRVGGDLRIAQDEVAVCGKINSYNHLDTELNPTSF